MRTTSLVATSALLALAIACSSSSGKGGYETQSGEELYKSAGCSACHGADGSGSRLNLGPALGGLREHWTKEKLLAYMGDPAAFAAGDARLGQRTMPAIGVDVPPEARDRLADHVLSMMD